MAPQQEPPTDILLRVKVPSDYLDSGDEFSVGSIPVSSRVGELRARIRDLLPSHPSIERQRLLYGGRALVDNEQTLAEALNTKRDASQGEYVVHLLVKGEQVGGGVGQHRRAVSTPTPAPAAVTGERTGSNSPLPHGLPLPPQMPIPGQPETLTPQQAQQQQAAMTQQIQQQQQAMIAHQRQVIAQAQRMGVMMPGLSVMPGVLQNGQMPQMPGTPQIFGPNGQQMQFGPDGQLLNPGQQAQIPQPQIRIQGQGFNQAVQQGQQQRAAMGMQGMPNGAQQRQQQNVTEQANAEGATSQAQAQAQAQQSIEQQQGQQQPANLDTPVRQPQQPPPTTEQQAPQGHQQHHQTQASQVQAEQPPRRPISAQGYQIQGTTPNGQRYTIHQQTMNFPGPPMPPGQQTAGMPPPQMGQMPMLPVHHGMQFQLPGFPGMMPMPFPGMPHPQQQQAQMRGHGGNVGGAPNALARARENMAEMRRMLDDMRNQRDGDGDARTLTEEERTRIAGLEERLGAVGDYIDPFRLHGSAGGTGVGVRSASPSGQTGQNAQPAQGLPPPPQARQLFSAQRHGVHVPRPQSAHQPAQTSDPADITAYLLSGPQGPQALLFSPQHGAYTGTLANNTLPQVAGQHLQRGPSGQNLLSPDIARIIGGPNAPTPTPTQPATPQAANAQTAQVAQQPAPPPGGAPAAQQPPRPQGAAAAQQQAQPQDPLAPIQPLLAHVWLLLRILIFAYFLLGANMGWRRPVALLLIGLGFWMIRLGLFGDGGVARRWWDGIVRVEGVRPQAQAVPHGGQQQAGAPAGEQQQLEGQQVARVGGMPTPEQAAQRLLADEQAQRPQNAQLRRLREAVRPVERAVALFVASLWPGVGEAHVRAREDEQRRVAEEEVQRQRRAQVDEEMEAKRKEDEERVKKERQEHQEGSTHGEKVAVGVTAEGAASGVEAGETGGEVRERSVAQSENAS